MSEKLPSLEPLFQILRNLEFAWNSALNRKHARNLDTFLGYQRLLSGGYAEAKAKLCLGAGVGIGFDWIWRPLKDPTTLAA